MKQHAWKMRERIVKLLEAALDPSARVSHDERLPDLVTGALRQFDVVVRTGPAHRETLTVVEVQKRGRAIGSEHVEGWVAKMRAVGAHRLICVTAKRFTRPALDAIAKRHGPVVLPLTLREMERKSWPFMVVGGVIELSVPHFKIRPNPAIVLYRAPDTPKDLAFPPLPAKQDDKIFVRNGRDVSMAELLTEELSKNAAIDRVPPGKSEGTIVLSTSGGTALSVRLQGALWPVETFAVDVEFDTREGTIPLTMMAYTPPNGASAIAFAVIAEGDVDGKDVCIRLAYQATEAGLVLRGVEWSGALPRGVLHIEDVTVEGAVMAQNEMALGTRGSAVEGSSSVDGQESASATDSPDLRDSTAGQPGVGEVSTPSSNPD